MFSKPAVAGNMILTGACNGLFYALDRSTGKPLWSFDIKKDGNQRSFHTNPVVENGTVYIGTDYGDYFKFKKDRVGHVYAADLRTGNLRWKYKVDVGVGSNLVIDKQNIFFITVGDELISLKKASGKFNWSFKTKGLVQGLYPKSTPVVQNGEIYFGSGDGHLYLLDKKTGKVKSKVDMGRGIYTPIEIHKNKIYVAAENRVLNRIDKKKLEVTGTFTIPDRPWTLVLSESDRIIVHGGKTLYCLDQELKGTVWKSDLGALPGARFPLVSKEVITVGCKDGRIISVSTKDGTPLWEYRVEGRIAGGIAEADGIIYFGTQEGKIYALKI